MEGLPRPPSFSDRRRSAFGCDELSLSTTAMKAVQTRPPRGPPTPSMTSTPAEEYDQAVTGSPPPPPTPAASPGPSHTQLDWSDASAEEDAFLGRVRSYFNACTSPQKTRLLADLLNLCNSQQLSFVHQFVSPLLKKDPFVSLPDELCLRILSFIDDPKVLARASQVSRRWRDILSDDITWKLLCEKHDYGRQLNAPPITAPSSVASSDEQAAAFPRSVSDTQISLSVDANNDESSSSNNNNNDSNGNGNSSSSSSNHLQQDHLSPFDAGSSLQLAGRHGSNVLAPLPHRLRPKLRSYKSHFKQRYLVDVAWRTGGKNITKNITQDGGVVTSLHLTNKYIIVALDNARIHVFNTEGEAQKTLQGHVMGVWAMIPWGDTLVSGGCDRDVRVWNLATGACIHTLRGHTSTVRCLKMADESTAISGSRDTTLRVWDIKSGLCRNVLVGHQGSVRCLEIKGDIVVSGSYDTRAKVWSISEGRCLHTLQGHYSQIYAIAFDGVRVATGSLDTSVRIWNAMTGECQAVLQGHTSLVGQLQMRGDTLVTGGSDGSVRVWSLSRFCPIHRLAAHGNSVTSLQFDETRVVSGGSDGRVKVWDLKTGQLVRELISHGDAVWRVAFEDTKCVAMALRGGRTVMEVWSFAPPEEEEHEDVLVPARTPVDRPLSAMDLDSRRTQNMLPEIPRRNSADQDIRMHDAGPATAPLQRGSTGFFHDA